MADEEFDGEATQFWLPGKDLPGQPTADDAANAAGGNNPLDFDLTTGEPASPSGLGFDVSADANAVPEMVDFDISGQGSSEPRAASNATPPTRRPPPVNSAEPRSGLMLVAFITIAGLVLYFITR